MLPEFNTIICGSKRILQFTDNITTHYVRTKVNDEYVIHEINTNTYLCGYREISCDSSFTDYIRLGTDSINYNYTFDFEVIDNSVVVTCKERDNRHPVIRQYKYINGEFIGSDTVPIYTYVVYNNEEYPIINYGDYTAMPSVTRGVLQYMTLNSQIAITTLNNINLHFVNFGGSTYNDPMYYNITCNKDTTSINIDYNNQLFVLSADNIRSNSIYYKTKGYAYMAREGVDTLEISLLDLYNNNALGFNPTTLEACISYKVTIQSATILITSSSEIGYDINNNYHTSTNRLISDVVTTFDISDSTIIAPDTINVTPSVTIQGIKMFVSVKSNNEASIINYTFYDADDNIIKTDVYTEGVDIPVEVRRIEVQQQVNQFTTNITSVPYEYVEPDEGDIIVYGEPAIDIYGSEDKPVTSKVLKNYVDIIINQNYNIVKILDSINYNLNEIETQYDANNIAEEELNRRFAGNSILIYTDECISGILNINVEKPINELDKYKVPYWDRGSWNFNYFRNNIIIAVNEDELRAQILELSYPDVAQNELISRNLYQLKEANRQNNNRTDYADRSDNRSLIYGKYFIIRFIFDNDRKIKLDTLDTNINIQ